MPLSTAPGVISPRSRPLCVLSPLLPPPPAVRPSRRYARSVPSWSRWDGNDTEEGERLGGRLDLGGSVLGVLDVEADAGAEPLVVERIDAEGEVERPVVEPERVELPLVR